MILMYQQSLMNFTQLIYQQKKHLSKLIMKNNKYLQGQFFTKGRIHSYQILSVIFAFAD